MSILPQVIFASQNEDLVRRRIGWPKAYPTPCIALMRLDPRSRGFLDLATHFMRCFKVASVQMNEHWATRAQAAPGSPHAKKLRDSCSLAQPNHCPCASAGEIHVEPNADLQLPLLGILSNEIVEQIILALAKIMGPYVAYDPVVLPDHPVNIFGKGRTPLGYTIDWP
mmetsp:Transcript_45784/g.76317  ORF Transcript_45784/g.76317 Transcript_45784/m.76317 type:complete len:168 (+) Transcript_45784:2-505(+)